MLFLKLASAAYIGRLHFTTLLRRLDAESSSFDRHVFTMYDAIYGTIAEAGSSNVGRFNDGNAFRGDALSRVSFAKAIATGGNRRLSLSNVHEGDESEASRDVAGVRVSFAIKDFREMRDSR